MTTTRNAYVCISRLVLAVAFTAATASTAAALTLALPSVDVKIDRVTAKEIRTDGGRVAGWDVSVNLSKGLAVGNTGDEARATNPSNYRIINISTGSTVKVSEATLIRITGSSTLDRVRLILPTADALNTTDLYHLYALNLTFGGQSAAVALQAPINVRSEATVAGPGEAPAPPKPIEIKPTWGLKSSKNRDDSDIFVSYQLTSARHRATTGTGDVKISIPFFKNFWNRTSKFSLTPIDLKASSDSGADADSLKISGEWFLPVYVNDNPDSTFLFPAVDWINTGKVEAPKNFNNINAIWESRWLFPSAQIGNGKRFRMFIDPFLGHELGKNLRSPLEEADGAAIARVYVGANLLVQFPIKNKDFLKRLEFTSTYIRRWPLKRELTVKENDDGSANLLTFGKGPKEYTDSKFIVMVNDYFGPFVGYEWGSLPPVYKFVDHKWTFGVLFKSKIKVK